MKGIIMSACIRWSMDPGQFGGGVENARRIYLACDYIVRYGIHVDAFQFSAHVLDFADF